jgi:hypothetical protein
LLLHLLLIVHGSHSCLGKGGRKFRACHLLRHPPERWPKPEITGAPDGAGRARRAGGMAKEDDIWCCVMYGQQGHGVRPLPRNLQQQAGEASRVRDCGPFPPSSFLTRFWVWLQPSIIASKHVHLTCRMRKALSAWAGSSSGRPSRPLSLLFVPPKPSSSIPLDRARKPPAHSPPGHTHCLKPPLVALNCATLPRIARQVTW